MFRGLHQLFKMDEADDGTSSDGTGGTGGILDTNAAPEGGGNDSPDKGGTPDPSTNLSTVQEGWLAGVDAEYANADSMKIVPDLPTLVKNYVNAQKMIGADKVVLPSKHATPDEWRQFFNKAGLPVEKEAYEVKASDEAYVNDEFITNFKDKAFELGIMPHQAQEMLNWYDSQLKTTSESIDAETLANYDKNVEALKTEYGQAYDAKVKLASAVFKEVADDDMKAYVEESGLQNDATFIKLLVRLGEKFQKEDAFDIHTNPLGHMTPDQAQNEINKIYSDPNHPYNNHMHPNHANAVAEMEKLVNFTIIE